MLSKYKITINTTVDVVLDKDCKIIGTKNIKKYICFLKKFDSEYYKLKFKIKR